MRALLTMGISLALGLSAGTAVAQGANGVACVFATLSEPTRAALVDTLANQDAPMSELQARQAEMQPAVQACTRSQGWTTREQQELSFAYALHAAQLVGVGRQLQALGVDPQSVEALYPSLPPGAEEKLVRTDLTDAESAELVDSMRTFLSSNGPAREAPARGLAFEFLKYVSLLFDVDRRFSAIG